METTVLAEMDVLLLIMTIAGQVVITLLEVLVQKYVLAELVINKR
jgi:hypothetical protein